MGANYPNLSYMWPFNLFNRNTIKPIVFCGDGIYISIIKKECDKLFDQFKYTIPKADMYRFYYSIMYYQQDL